eukprot:scaffold364602_cov32-Prasinocladus_malaysianus.AAC.1
MPSVYFYIYNGWNGSPYIYYRGNAVTRVSLWRAVSQGNKERVSYLGRVSFEICVPIMRHVPS